MLALANITVGYNFLELQFGPRDIFILVIESIGWPIWRCNCIVGSSEGAQVRTSEFRERAVVSYLCCAREFDFAYGN